MKPELTNTALFKAKPGMSDTLGSRLLALVGPTRKEPGCLGYDIFQSAEDADIWIVIEHWQNQAAFDFHLGTQYVRGFLADYLSFSSQDVDLQPYRQMSPLKVAA